MVRWRLDRLELEHDADRGLQLPGDHRQRHRYGALLLHPLRPADVLQERLRGPHRHAVPSQRGSARHRRDGDGLRGVAPGLRSQLLRPLVHDQLAAQHLRRFQGRVDPDQLPLSGDPGLVRPHVGRHRRKAQGARRIHGDEAFRGNDQGCQQGLSAGRRDLEAQDPHRQSATGRRRRRGLSDAPLVSAVLRRRRRHFPGHDRPFRTRGGHHQGQ